MRPPYHIPIWKQAPSLRILLPIIAGIVLQWYGHFSLSYILVCFACFITAFLLFSLLPNSSQYRLFKYRGLVFHLLLISFAMLLSWQKDMRHFNKWYGNFITDSSILLVKINEPPVIKARSVKADGLVEAVINGTGQISTKGKLLLYFSKDSLPYNLQYGQYILVNKKLQSITNSGNPGAFNYKRYAAFQLLYHQAFLKREDWIATNKFSINYFQLFLFNARDYVLSVLKKYIGDRNNELGIAEALLIGYKEDLDKDLVQAYSNTGVVHIIAISGLHLGLIYLVLKWLFDHLPYLKKSKHFKAVALITCLWLFSLLTGGSASVLRSAVMFTVIILGEYYFKHSSIYNSLSVSALILLLYNPYFLWDVGFQLSYAAVLGIVAFQPYLYRLWYPPQQRFVKWICKNTWGLVTASLAATIGTLPLCIYYFHQAPTLFLFSNLVAVPWSTIVLFGEIFLIIIGSWHWLAYYIGIALTWAIRALNNVILFFDSFSFSVIDNIYANIFTTWALYGFSVFGMLWILQKRKAFLKATLVCAVLCTGLYSYAFIKREQQKKIIIYNISRMKAVDFIYKKHYVFTGDSALLQPGLQQNFHLKPARISLLANNKKDSLPVLMGSGHYRLFCNKRMLMLDSSFLPERLPPADIILLSYNPAVDITQLHFSTKPDCIVFDASNSLWKIQKWKSQCEQLILRCHSVSEKGAFVLSIE